MAYERYNRTSWESGDIIKKGGLNNIEDGIENLENYLLDNLETVENAASNIARIDAALDEMEGKAQEIEDTVGIWLNQQRSELLDTFNNMFSTSITSFNEQFNEYSETLQGIISSADESFSTKVNISDIYGAGGVNNEGKENLKAWIESELGELSSAVESNINPKLDIIGNALGPAYYDNNAWISNPTEDDIDTRINGLYAAIYGETSSSEEPSSSLIEQLEQLNTAIFGSSEGGTASGSLIDKIETAIGRDLEPTAAQIAEDADLDVSLYELIKSIKGALGMPGGTSGQQNQSSLIDDVNTALNLLYGYTYTRTETENPEDPEHPIVTESYTRNAAPNLNQSFSNSYPTLYNDFYGDVGNPSVLVQLSNLASSVNDNTQAVNSLATSITSYDDALESIGTKYCGSDIVTFNDTGNTYLALKMDRQKDVVASENDINNDVDIDYVLLPKMGGGGGVEYELEASIVPQSQETPIFPTNKVITLGDEYLTRFIWQVTQDDAPQSLNGVLTVRLNNIVVDTLYIMSNVNFSLDLGQYISSTGNNSFVLLISNPAVRQLTRYDTVNVYNAVLTSTFNANTIQTGSTISLPYVATIGSSTIEKTLHINLDGEPLSLTGNISTSEALRSVSFSTPSEGAHLLEVWFTATIINNGVTSTLTSNILSFGILCGESNRTRIATNFTQTSIEQYNVLTIDYLVVTPNVETTLVNFYINNSSTPITEQVTPVYHSFDYTVTQAGGTLTIRIEANGTEKILQVEVITNAVYDFSIVEEGLKLKLDAEGRTNVGNKTDLSQWNNTAQLNNDDPYRNYYGTLNNNFLFYSENNYDGWLRNNNGHNFLRLRNRDMVTINLPIFNFSIANEKIIDGMTFEIDFQTSNVTDYTAPIISCFEQDNAQSKSIIFTPQGLTINNTTELKTQFKEEERLTITIVVENSDNGPLYQLFKIYINGILSAATIYETTSLNFANISKGIIQLGSEKCTLDIYSIRFYNRALTFPEVIKNWIANEDLYQNKVAYFNRNNYSGNQGHITMTDNAFTLASPNTPYMIIRGEGDWNNEDGLNALPTTKSAGTYTTEDKQIMVEYIDPLDSTKSFTTDFAGGSVGVAIQGTSSQEYKRKNYKIKLNVFKQNGVTHVKKPQKSANKDEYYTDNTYTTLKDGYSDEGYKLIDTSIPTFTFCIKADVASSESANNVQLVKLYNDVVKTVELTPPQGDNEQIRQGIDGYPMVVWYFNNITKQYIFLGKYNFNNDKGTEEVYGFEDGDESWEVGNNEKLLCFFDESEDPTWANWRTAFETRFPDDDDSMTKEKDPYTDAQIADRLAGLKEMVHWVSSSVEWDSEAKASVHFNNTPTSEDIANAAITGKSAAEEAFKREFKQYFNIDLITFFYIFTEFFLMVDNRAKNMFLTRYKVSATRPDNARWHNEYGDNIVELADTTSSRDTYAGWFSLPYDMDTGLGTNNVGVYTFDYHYETGDLQPGGAVVFNGQKSKLWVAFAQVFPSEIQDMYTRFQNNVSYTTLENSFEAHQGVWSETVVNEDMEAKYIDWITAYDANNKPLTRDTRALPMLLGLKTEQRKWWLENRFKYLNSKYALDAGTDFISLGARSGLLNIPVSVYADAYVTFKVGAQDSAPTTIRLAAGQSGIIERNASGEGGSDRVESSVSPASRISSIENLASLDLLNVDFTRASRLQTLRLGSASIVNNRLTSISLTGNRLLRLFDLRNYAAYTADLSVNECYNLEYIYLSGTHITNVNLPQGGVLKTIQYPETINTIRIINQPYLENLIIGAYLPADEITDEINETEFTGNNDYSNISSIILDNIGENIDVTEILYGSNNITNCQLSNLTFRMRGDDFEDMFNELVSIETRTENSTVTVENCILYLSSDLPTMTINEITSKYDFKIYDKDGNEYFNVKFYDFSHNIINIQSVTAGTTGLVGPVAYFTEEYLNNYSGITVNNFTQHDTRIGFGGWNYDFSQAGGIQTNLEVNPIQITQYRLDYHYYLDENTLGTKFKYLALDDTIRSLTNEELENKYYYVKDYYVYSIRYWSLSGSAPGIYPENAASQPQATGATKQNYVEHLYAIYDHDNYAMYEISVYNTDLDGNKANLLHTFTGKQVLGSDTSKLYISESELMPYLPAENGTSIYDATNHQMLESNKSLDTRDYLFLDWNPPVLNNNGIKVRGNMEILLKYYKKDDDFTNYFINKLIKCTLTNDTVALPEGAFFHNTNLEYLYAPNVTHIGPYSFANYADENAALKRKILIFGTNSMSSNIYLDEGCFYGIRNALIVFLTNGDIKMHKYCFSNIKNCQILIPNSLHMVEAIQEGSGYQTSRGPCFEYFRTATGTENNVVYVSSAAKTEYNGVPSDNTTLGISGLIDDIDRTVIAGSDQRYSDLLTELREAGFNDT